MDKEQEIIDEVIEKMNKHSNKRKYLNGLIDEVIEKIEVEKSIGFMNMNYNQKRVKLDKYFKENTRMFKENSTVDEIIEYLKKQSKDIDFLRDLVEKKAQNKTQSKNNGWNGDENEKIILREIKSRHTRMGSHQKELNQKYYVLLQMHIVTLSIIVAIMAFVAENVGNNLWIVLFPVGLILWSSVMLMSRIITPINIKKIDRELINNNNNVRTGKEIISTLIKEYESAQEKAISEYDKMGKQLRSPKILLIVNIFSFILLIIII